MGTTTTTKNDNECDQIFYCPDHSLTKESKLNELIKLAHKIAHENNKSYTYNEAEIYDPLISTLSDALRLLEVEN